MGDLRRDGLGGVHRLEVIRRVAELEGKAGPVESERGSGCARVLASRENALNATAPGLNFAGAEEDIGDGGIERGGGVLAEEVFSPLRS